MPSVWATIIDELQEAVRAAVPEADDVAFATPPDAAMGDIAVPCFALAKTLQQPPAQIAERIAEALSAHPLVEQRGVKVDGRVVEDPQATIVIPDSGVLIQKGKRHFVRVLGT